MPPSRQIVADPGRHAIFDLEDAGKALVVVERAERMQRIDPRRLDRLLHVHPEHEQVEQDVQDLLILAVAAGRADGKKRLAALEHDRRRQRRPRPLPAGEHVGAERIEIEHLHAIRQRNAGVAGDECAAQQPSRTRRDAEQVSVLVDNGHACRITHDGGTLRPLCVWDITRGWGSRVRIERKRIAGAMLERGGFPDEATPFCRVRPRQQPNDRHLRERRIAIERVAVVVGELDRFVDGVEIVRRIVPERPQVDALEDVQRLQQHRPLIPGAGFVHVEAVEVDRDRLFDRAVIRGEVVVRKHAASGAVGVDDPPRDVAGVERVTAGADRGSTVVRAFERGVLCGDDRAERFREIRLTEHLADFAHPTIWVVGVLRPLERFGRLTLPRQDVAQEPVHRKPIGVLDRRLHDLLESHRALRFERKRHRVEHGGDGGSERAVAVDLALGFEELGGRRAWRGTLAVDDDHFARLRVVDHRRRFAAEPEV